MQDDSQVNSSAVMDAQSYGERLGALGKRLADALAAERSAGDAVVRARDEAAAIVRDARTEATTLVMQAETRVAAIKQEAYVQALISEMTAHRAMTAMGDARSPQE